MQLESRETAEVREGHLFLERGKGGRGKPRPRATPWRVKVAGADHQTLYICPGVILLPFETSTEVSNPSTKLRASPCPVLPLSQ